VKAPWGHGETYQLGHDRHDNESQPKEVEALSRVRIVDVALGEKHMLALNELGQPYSWGTGAQGQLGHGPLALEEKLPRMLTICSRTQSKNFVETTRDIPWGSFYIMKDKEPGSTEEQEIEFTQSGKVCAVAACGNYSVFVLKRVANREEVLKYKEAVTRGDSSVKKND
jgi:alpha-tubulin suppressor-like RCC1 family protein